MPRPRLRTLHRSICMTVGVAVASQSITVMADQGGTNDFARRTLPKAADYPAGTSSFASPSPTSRWSGPVEQDSSTPALKTKWRMCGHCGYDGETPKAFKSMGLRANFQPIGGTFSYRF